MPGEKWQSIIARVASDTTFYNSLRSALMTEVGALGVPIIDGLRSNNIAGVAHMLRDPRIALTVMMLDRARNGNMGFLGYYKMPTEGGMRRFPALMAALQSPHMTKEQRDLALQILGTFVSVIMDHRYSCSGNEAGNRSCGDGGGTGNQGLQLAQSRFIGCLLLDQHASSANSEFNLCVQRAIDDGVSTIYSTLRADGSLVDSPGYIGTFADPANTWTRVLVNLGYKPASLFESRWKATQRFYSDLISSPDARFASPRQQILGGNSIIEQPAHVGGAPFSDPNGCWMWKNPFNQIRLTGSFYNTTLVTHDTECAPAEPLMGCGQYPNYGQAIRRGWGTANETYFFMTTAPKFDHQYSLPGQHYLWWRSGVPDHHSPHQQGRSHDRRY
jgi:hypothetical protein